MALFMCYHSPLGYFQIRAPCKVNLALPELPERVVGSLGVSVQLPYIGNQEKKHFWFLAAGLLEIFSLVLFWPMEFFKLHFQFLWFLSRLISCRFQQHDKHFVVMC